MSGSGRTMLKRARQSLVGVLLVATFGTAQALGTLAASSYDDSQTRAAQARIDSAHRAFVAQVAQAISDGTPAQLVDPLVAREGVLYREPVVGRQYMVDRVALAKLQDKADRMAQMKSQVDGVEIQAETAIHTQLVEAVKALRADLKPATDAGLDAADYSKYADDTEAQNQGLKTPKAAQALLDAVRAKDAALQAATVAKVASNQAFQAAQGGAQSALARAQAALNRARSVPVLKVDGASAAISALAARLGGSNTTADYQDIAAQLLSQAAALDNLVNARQSAYDLLGLVRARLAKAKASGLDVTASTAALDAAAASLDAASDLASITDAKNRVQGAKNDIDVKYNLATYGPGKVIVISLQDQELEALQDGVVLQDTLITSGRPALPSPTGTWSITAKFTPYHMVSPWPPGDQYYYNPVWIKYAMLWHDGGYFIHDAPWRYHYGPGSDSEFGGTHGCINVPAGSIGWLYGWAEVGTKVDVLPGTF